MIWIVLQNEIGMVNMAMAMDIFIKQKQGKSRIFARIAPDVVARDMSQTSLIELGAYKDMDSAKAVFGALIEFIGERTEDQTLFRMPYEDDV